MMSSLNVVQAVLLSIISYLSVINAIINVTDFNNRVPSLYEQLCCLDNNRGEVFVITDDDDETIKCIFCPPQIPSSCNAYNDYLTSCSAMLKLFPKAKSGYYNITPTTTNNTITVYCDMEGDNCDGEGGWIRMAYLNMTDSAHQCPPGFTLYNENGIRSCGRQEGNDCQSAEYPSNGVSYSRVCGRVIGYQKGSPDAFINFNGNGIDQAFADGVILTRDNTTKHIWTFAVGYSESLLPVYDCPCVDSNPNAPLPPTFVGNDYYCESGNQLLVGFNTSIFFLNDPLWDGQQCGQIEEACCSVPGIPWFNKVLDESTTDDIELRVCCDEEVLYEDVRVNYYEIYVK